jgi:predicted nucleotidyltransferase
MKTIVDLIEIVAARLEELRERVVFVGGATTMLFITDPAVTDIRPTKDIDVIVEVVSFAKYAELEELLREKGFRNLMDVNAPICRWTVEGVLVDVMPTLTEILGFSNRWYQRAASECMRYTLPSGMTIQLIKPELFVATKIEAFLGRGDDDFIMSHDIEDIFSIVDGRPELIEEIEASEEDVRRFIREQIAVFISESDFLNAVLGYLPTDTTGQARYRILLDRLKRIGAQAI